LRRGGLESSSSGTAQVTREPAGSTTVRSAASVSSGAAGVRQAVCPLPGLCTRRPTAAAPATSHDESRSLSVASEVAQVTSCGEAQDARVDAPAGTCARLCHEASQRADRLPGQQALTSSIFSPPTARAGITSVAQRTLALRISSPALPGSRRCRAVWNSQAPPSLDLVLPACDANESPTRHDRQRCDEGRRSATLPAGEGVASARRSSQNFPAWKSLNAWRISSIVFITNGP
jgi:hypothetical protein